MDSLPHETKAFGHEPDAAFTYDGFRRDLEEFKAENDRRLAEIEAKGHADVLVTDKLDRLNANLDRQLAHFQQLDVKARRPRLEGGPLALVTPPERKAAFDAYVRRGDTSRLMALEEKALSVGVNADGGFTVPLEIEGEIGQRLAKLSPIRALATVRQVTSAVYRKPIAKTALQAGWVGETANRTQSTTPTLDGLDFPTMELYAMPAATQAILDDSATDIERWIADEVEMSFAEQEGQAFVTGDGTGKPKGFLASTMIADASWEWGKLGFITSGKADGLAASNPSDRLVDLVYALRAGYRQNGVFVMNRKTQAEIRKLKDGQGHYLWQPPSLLGGQASLMNFPLVEVEDMPDIAADAFPIAFGDFRRGYLVVDRMGVRVLRDPFSAKPYVLFYTTKRVGGGVQDFAAIKVMKIAL